MFTLTDCLVTGDPQLMRSSQGKPFLLFKVICANATCGIVVFDQQLIEATKDLRIGDVIDLQSKSVQIRARYETLNLTLLKFERTRKAA